MNSFYYCNVTWCYRHFLSYNKVLWEGMESEIIILSKVTETQENIVHVICVEPKGTNLNKDSMRH